MTISAQMATSIDIAAATNAGRPIVLSSPDHPSSRAVRALAGTLSGFSRTSRTRSPLTTPKDDAGNADELTT